MAAMPQLSSVESVEPKRSPEFRAGAITKLARLHAEAEETARLANLLGRSVHAAIALPVLAVLTIGFADGDVARQLVWCGFVLAVSIAIAVAYARAIRRPFERDALKEFAKDLSAILLFSGFAWGAGAFLALPAGSDPIAAVLFVAVPAIAMAALLREREAVFLFLAPVATLASFASVLRPTGSGAIDAGLVLLVSAAIAGGAVLADPHRERQMPAMLPLR
ncbi:MAG: hypothetical protein KGJ78_18055 [Alphaproteobacteria bacterium]|nr:hypothetical protein [Alphaproteobacteria bacterium]